MYGLLRELGLSITSKDLVQNPRLLVDDEGVVAEGGAFNKRGRIWYKILDSWQMRKGLLQKLGLSIDEEGIVAIAGGSGKQGRSHCED